MVEVGPWLTATLMAALVFCTEKMQLCQRLWYGAKILIFAQEPGEKSAKLFNHKILTQIFRRHMLESGNCPWRPVMFRCFGYAVIAITLTTPAIARSKAAEFLIRKEIAGACESSKGRIDDSAVIERDLNGDGMVDLIISHEGITCSGSEFGRSNACGIRVCSVNIYLRRDGLLKPEVTDLLGMMVTVGGGKIPTIRMRNHGGGANSMKWDGTAFR